MAAPSPRRASPSLLAAGIALLLLALGAWFSGAAERSAAPPERPPIRFPSHPRQQEWERIQARQTLPAPAEPSTGRSDEDPPVLRDPFLRALPIREGDPFVVLEANALRHSRLGELFVQCILADHPEAFSEIAKETGIDPLKDVDRVAFTGAAVVVSGYFDRVRWEAYEEETGTRGVRYGDEATLWASSDEEALAAWRGQLVIAGPATDVRRAIDQLEGRAEPPRKDLADEIGYGELYGVVPGAAARRLLPSGDAGLGERIAEAAQRIELHVDAREDVAGVIRVSSAPGAAVDDLSRSLGAALSVARVKAAATNDRKLAALLENAQVVPGEAGFRVEIALPAEVLQEFFRDCVKGRAP